MQPNLTLGIAGFRYPDLYDYDRLRDLSHEFDESLRAQSAELFEKFDRYRLAMQSGAAHGGLTPPDESALLIEVSALLGAFLTRLFAIEPETMALRTIAARDAQVAKFKKEFVTKRVAKVPAGAPPPSPAVDVSTLVQMLAPGLELDPELAVATAAIRLLDLERVMPRGAKDSAPSAEALAGLEQITTLLALSPEASSLHAITDNLSWWAANRWREGAFEGWTSFRLPKPLNYQALVATEKVDDLRFGGVSSHFRRRDGFKLTDDRGTPRFISDQSFYCIWCHERQKDSCAHGFVEKDGTYRLNPLGMPLTGCPLDEKIGEMNFLRAAGDSIAALAVTMIDNPMCPGTGHRICNDCMRGCIYQKQDPVDIPQIETGVLTDVLFLPWGFEIYSLMTRWNPVHVRRPMALPYNGRNVLVVGLGPAGYTLAHYLANEGFGVVAIDGLKIEPLDEKTLHEPIHDAHSLWEQLDDRVLAGFGGVSEYGITVRWDKNFLKVIRIALERKKNIRIYGGVRFGGTLTIEDAFDRLGFDHIAIAAGAGTPTIVRMKNNLIRGIRKASDFLMALQLGGAFKKTSMANLQVRMPAVVIGGGLTAIDTATELMAYYPVQVEQILERYDTLCREMSEPAVRAGYDPEESRILDEFLMHGRAVRAERERARSAGEKPDFVPMLRAWGGVTIAYRKSMLDSPAYRLNHEEIIKAFEEGIYYAENLSPVEAMNDEFGHVSSILFEKQIVEDGRWKDSGVVVDMAARSVMVAAGTAPNVIYEKEHPGTFKLDKYGQFFQAHASAGTKLVEADPAKETGFFTSYQHPTASDKRITFYGDNHPRYAGNVVKAMASARDGYPHVAALFPAAAELDRTEMEAKWAGLTALLDDSFIARVHAINRLTPTIVEVVVRAPFAARQFEPGQFYRLQNYETYAREVAGTRLVMEGIALTGAWTDKERGLLSMIILEMGGSSRLCAMLEPGEAVVVMGPTGTPTEIPRNETVLLAGGGLGNAVLFSIARALKDNGCSVVYFAGYKKYADVFKRDEIEAGTDQVIWAVDAGQAILARREQDLSFVGNIVQAMRSYASGELGEPLFDLREATRVIAIGSDGMMRAVKEARHTVLAPFLSPTHTAIGSINSPMQCMMKQVCAQCLQRHVDPKTGKESFIFSCFNQDQPLDDVDFVNLRARLRQNTVLEKLANLWLTRCLAKEQLTAV